MWFFSSRKARPRTAVRPRPCSRRPRVEVLEDRTVPASLSYSTFLHGIVLATAVDGAGNIYVTGRTDSGLPTTSGAFETSGAGAFVAKLNPTGTAVLYATYLGNFDWGQCAGTGIAVDAAGDAYVIAQQNNVPTTANAIASSGPNNGACVVELNPTGSGLIYATYLPGTVTFPITWGYAGAIAVDGSGNIYVAGSAQAGLPVTASAFQTAYLGGSGGLAGNAFFMEINPALSGTASVVYATYLGGKGGDAATAIALDGAGNAYLEGYTWSSNFPTTGGAFQTTLGGGTGTENAFVAKINPSLSGAASLVYSTYLGGSGLSGYVPSNGNANDITQIDGGIAVDSAGNAYVTSATTSLNFPTTPGAYQVNSNMPSLNDGFRNPSDVFVTKLNSTGSALVYSTYIGGGSFVSGKYHGKPVISGTRSGGASIAVDASGDAELTGWTNSTKFPTVNALQTANGGGYDAVVTVVNPTG
ncbi:MAG TPA: SBBP repeat-containing protein, partial [Gemmataceae bacterium]|nr:SBBP repeat-containing protein [Gemmataceae bacterium]